MFLIMLVWCCDLFILFHIPKVLTKVLTFEKSVKAFKITAFYTVPLHLFAFDSFLFEEDFNYRLFSAWGSSCFHKLKLALCLTN
jgi:hypothetical protein